MTSPMYAVLDEMRALHDRKSRDYGADTDPFANVRASEEFGVPAWLGAIIRLNDKITRIKSFTAHGELANESLRDSLIDIAVYSAISVALYDQAQEAPAQLPLALECAEVCECTEVAVCGNEWYKGGVTHYCQREPRHPLTDGEFHTDGELQW